MIIQPMILAFPTVVIWHYINGWGWHSTRVADEPIVNAILPLIGGFHVFLAGFLLYSKANDITKFKEVICSEEEGVEKNNEKKFLQLAEDRIPQPLKYVLLSTGTLVQLWTASLYYDSYWIGFFSVYSVSYIIVLIWEVITDLDDPVHGVWVVKGIPAAWAKKAHFDKRFVDKVFDNVFGQTN
jgi:hypothetical protein